MRRKSNDILQRIADAPEQARKAKKGTKVSRDRETKD